MAPKKKNQTASNGHSGARDPGWMRAQINQAYEFLRELKLAQARNDRVDYPSDLGGTVRKGTYLEEWRYFVASGYYDIMLGEQSLFQFKLPRTDGRDHSFCYYECPLQVPEYREFVADQLAGELIEPDDFSFWDEYEMVLETAPLKASVAPFRYDFNPGMFVECVHPAAHLHVGYQTSIRIGTERCVEPFSFVLFVVRQHFPDRWLKFLESDGAASVCRKIRDDLELVDEEFRSGKNRWQMILS